MGRTALITGVAGQDGVYLSRLLRREGYHVIGTVPPGSNSHRRLESYLTAAEVDIVEVSVSDGAAMHDLIVSRRPDEIYNLAAMSSVGASWQAAERVAEVNGMAVLRLLEALLAYRERFGEAPRFYQASSSEIFGLAKQQPQAEDTPHHPRSPYGAAKSFAHYLTLNYRESYDLFACNGILFNHESPLRSTTFVTRKITRAVAEIHLGRRRELSLGNIDVRRDWGAAEDYVRAMWLMLQSARADDYVIATGIVTSLREFVEIAFRCVGIDDPWSFVRLDPAIVRPADVHQTWGDSARARDRLDWAPQTSTAALIERMVAVDIERLRSGVEESPRLLASAPEALA